MKKSLLSMMIVLGMATSAVGMNLGVHTGLGLTNISTETSGTSVSTDGAATFAFGGTLEFQMSDWFYIQPELNYEKYSTSGCTDCPSYLAVPVLFKGKFNAGSVSPFVYIGPALGLKMSGSDLASGTNFSSVIGGGAEFALTPTVNLSLDLRYNLGLSNILKNSTIVTQKTKGLFILAGVSFAM